MPHSEEKIFLDRTDNLTTVVDKLIKTSARKVILNIPKNSAFSDSLHNFRVLKRESVTAGKELSIESVDEHVLELAEVCGIAATNPIFKTRERSVSDILPRSGFEKDHDFSSMRDKLAASSSEAVPEKKAQKAALFAKPIKEPPLAFKKEKPSGKSVFKRLIFWLAAIAVIFMVFEVVTKILPRATVTITQTKYDAKFDETVQAASAVTQVDLSVTKKISLPAELLSSSCNVSMTFPASGKAQVEVNASGTLWIYNAYSSAPQTLVKSTRFQAPDGHIFRLVTQVAVPGAKIVNSQIQPSKILAAVVADKPGADYNIGPAAGWKIPGFSGTPRYQGFYAESLVPMAGGFIGEKAVPSPSDILNATTSIETSLANDCQSKLMFGGSVSSQFKLFDNAKQFKILKENIGGGTAEAGKFNVDAEGELRELVFDEQMLRTALENQAAATLPQDLKVLNPDFAVNYGNPQVDLTNGKMTFSAAGSMTFVADFDIDKFRGSVLGKDEATLRTLVFALPGLDKATISLWPFWVKAVPNDSAKVKIVVN